jgi:hypothetical protein
MDEFGVWPGLVGFKIRWANKDRGWIIGGASWIDGAVYCIFQAGVVECIVLGIASYSDIWFGSLEVSEVVEEVV